ncbi:Na+/H+ antiporter NhaA [Flavobacterium sp. I-SCBP12n]|uniref:Na(+)/H(+) antiporter NhaA n=1 Tax=Flavobacterium pygoscelis TaxID=2893176 RepID=A0A9X2BL36_9FLAO|nr:Na+/H+ antiporter NhaA [Flavobacterium pygoscelis]MCK8142134.1 Na+/H+ antiporter NhaA [Flavobacterium pygoscelis]
MKITALFKEFYESEKAGGVILLFVTIISLALANSPIQSSYIDFWQFDIGGHSITHWINDALMAVFFLLIGLELEREIYKGELSDIKNASFPLIGAMGGFIIPACIFLLFNFGTATQAGAGIPMATDIAFAIGILSLLGNRVPLSLKIFLTALAVIDDLIAIIVIAIFYTKTIIWTNLLLSLAVFAVLLLLNRLKVKNLIPYLVGGVVMWYFMYNSGVHATITGVLLAFAIPFGNGDKKSTSYVLQHFLHKPVAFVILPLFAIANTSIAIGADWQNGLGESNSIGIIAGLILGKPIGIVAFAFTGALIGLCKLPKGLQWKNIVGVGLLGGIGFTMSIFITILAYDDVALINSSKIAIILASVTAGLLGFVFLKFTLKPKSKFKKPSELE